MCILPMYYHKEIYWKPIMYQMLYFGSGAEVDGSSSIIILVS